METVTHSYRIHFQEKDAPSSGEIVCFDFRFDAESFELINNSAADTSYALPRWTELSYNQCEHCPLDHKDISHCPIAVNLHQVVKRFDHKQSIDTVELEVISSNRKVIQQTDLQHAIASMLNLILPGCGCPKTRKLKALSCFHMPIISEEEALFQLTSLHLMGSYFQNANGSGKADFSDLPAFYQDMHILNKAIVRRMQIASESDACKNAVTLQDMYATLIPVLLEDNLQELRPLFEDFLADESPSRNNSMIDSHEPLSPQLELSTLESA